MKKKVDISWKDFLALLVGYFVSVVCVGTLFFGAGYFRAKGIVGEDVFVRHEFLIAIVTFLGSAVGGGVLAAIRPNVALRNAGALFLLMILYGIGQSIEENVSIISILWSSAQVGGVVFGAWIFHTWRHS